MCGRFENKVREDWMMEKFAEFDISVFFNTSTNERKFENIAPTNSIVTIMNDDNDLSADMNKWGIKFAVKSPLIFNSRIETISVKPFWKMLFDRNRCLVPMTAFYEWKKVGTKKVPYRISLKKQEIFFVPGLYNKDKEGIKFVSLITTEPNDFMKEIHNRMPVILEMQEAVKYLSADSESNFEKCLPYKNSGDMEMELAVI
ncbi:MAG: SOS response-associated peptidase [Ignavibacteriales bacterium]|nr:SOS response-associated peptidase [Ignavibacteriales bacterium]